MLQESLDTDVVPCSYCVCVVLGWLAGSCFWCLRDVFDPEMKDKRSEGCRAFVSEGGWWVRH